MAHEITSKNMDGITDLVVVAPIKEGFIQAYENVTFATRLRIVSEALNRVRVAAREYERITPFSDVTQRILTLLDFRVGVLDKDLFSLPHVKDKEKWRLQSRRFLYLTATFDGALEPYMRQIWNPLGPFLDLLFCNCEGYVTASEHSFDEYFQWVRDNQMDSAIFYAASGLTVRDHLYLDKLERLQRANPPAVSELAIARLAMPNPEAAAKAEREKALKDLLKGEREQYRKIHELALEALTVLYRLVDFYPPEWLIKQPGLSEGQYLARVAKDLLQGWDELIPTTPGPLKDHWDERVVPAYRDPLHWFETGKKHLHALDEKRRSDQPKDRELDRSEIQGGVLKAQGSRDNPVQHGALMMMTITSADGARNFIKNLGIHYAEGEGSVPSDDFYRTIGFTAAGLRRIGLDTALIDHFPKEFREGMEMRAGLLGDLRENHPRDWKLPKRGWPRLRGDGEDNAKPRPPTELGEIDFVVQVRTTDEDREKLIAEVRRLAELAQGGASLQSCQLMLSRHETEGISRDFFGFRDGISQPKPIPGIDDAYQRQPDEVRLGELLLGYRNDRGDYAPKRFGPTFPEWRQRKREESLGYQFNGSFLAVRKLEQHVSAFEAFISKETARINAEHPNLAEPMKPDRLMAKLIGRHPDGQPLVESRDGSLNNFRYDGDEKGEQCPFASHIRRANPRNEFQGRPAPRFVRRGMSYDERESGGGRGLVFMAYNASLAEQYETIQRWINGANSTDVAAGHNDPMFGVAPRTGAFDQAARVFRFVEGAEVIRVTLPESFVSMHWGLYLFVPSRTALDKLCALEAGYRPMDESLEMRGLEVIERMDKIADPETQGQEWKRLLEDFEAKDPAERNISPDVWSAIRYYRGGSIKIPGVETVVHNWDGLPSKIDQPMVICASYRHVMKVLANWHTYSTEEQLRRIETNSGPIFVTQQPDNIYKASRFNGKYNYRSDSEKTNKILMAYNEDSGFDAGYEAGREVLAKIQTAAARNDRDYYKIEVRRQYLLPALGGLCRRWYGLPDGTHMHFGGWLWEDPGDRTPPGPRCPGDFLSPSRNAFYPRPSETVAQFADAHGKAILQGSLAFVKANRPDEGAKTGSIAREMFKVIGEDEVLARNLIGTMVGAIPPMDGNLRGVLLEWLNEKTLWRHQAALHAATGGQPASSDSAAARSVLSGPVSQAMCKRPAPDLLYRTATGPATLQASGDDRSRDISIKERDLVVVSLVSAAQRSLQRSPDGDVSIVFGGKRNAPYQSDPNDTEHPVHACPAQAMAMGAIMGILAALLDAGRIQALPASLIVKISDWPREAPPPGQ